MGPIGLSVEEENMRAAPGTPQAAQAEGGKLFAIIVPKSNMSEATQGETMSVTLTRGYFTEAVEEAKVVGRGAIIPHELDCFAQARKIMRLIRNKKVVPSTVDLPKGGYSRMAVDPTQMERLWDAWATAVLTDDAFHLPLHCAERDEPWFRQDGDLAPVPGGQWHGSRNQDSCGHVSRIRPPCVQGGVRCSGCDRVLSVGPDIQHFISEE